MLAFCCAHVANGKDIWEMVRQPAEGDLPEHLSVMCRICTGLPESSFTADDCVVLSSHHLEPLFDRLTAT